MIVVDTGPLVSLINTEDADHERCLRWYDQSHGKLLIPAPILAEVAYLLEREVGSLAEAQFFRELAADDQFEVVLPSRGDFVRVAELIEKYADLPLGGSDATVIAVAERLGATQVATLDYRHFSVVRPRNTAAFELVI